MLEAALQRSVRSRNFAGRHVASCVIPRHPVGFRFRVHVCRLCRCACVVAKVVADTSESVAADKDIRWLAAEGRCCDRSAARREGCTIRRQWVKEERVRVGGAISLPHFRARSFFI